MHKATRKVSQKYYIRADGIVGQDKHCVVLGSCTVRYNGMGMWVELAPVSEI